jgi:hypothetical protein
VEGLGLGTSELLYDGLVMHGGDCISWVRGVGLGFRSQIGNCGEWQELRILSLVFLFLALKRKLWVSKGRFLNVWPGPRQDSRVPNKQTNKPSVQLSISQSVAAFNPLSSTRLWFKMDIRTHESASEDEEDEEYEDGPEVTLHSIAKSKTINFSIRANYTNWAPREAFRELVQNWYVPIREVDLSQQLASS